MATSRGTRIGIWIIAVVMLVGTIGSFLVMVLANDNQQMDQTRLETLMSEYQKEVDTQAKQLSEKYYPTMSKYASVPDVFNAGDVKELTTKDLVVGTGETLTKDTAYSAYYIGWNPKGVIFDQSIEGATLKTPISGGNLIEGWNEGVIGMKMGGVRELTIPSAKAYGETGSGENIPANTPIKFIVMVIPPVEEVQPSEELLKLYGQQ